MRNDADGPVRPRRVWLWVAVSVGAIGLLTGLGLLYASATSKPPYDVNLPKVVATVGERSITREAVYRRMRQHEGMKPGGFEKHDPVALGRLAGRVIDTLIQQQAMLNEAARMELAVTDAEVDAQYAQTQASLGGAEAFERKMREGRTDPRTLRGDIREFLTIQKLDATLQETLVVTEDEITEFFGANKAQLLQDHARVRHILVDSLEKAEDVLKRLSKDQQVFAELAKGYSLDAGSRSAGGELGWIARGQTEPEFDRAVFAMEAGDTSSPVRTRYGYHIIQVEEVQPAGHQTLADHREHILSILQQQKWQAVKGAWLETVAANASVWRAPGIPASQPRGGQG